MAGHQQIEDPRRGALGVDHRIEDLAGVVFMEGVEVVEEKVGDALDRGQRVEGLFAGEGDAVGGCVVRLGRAAILSLMYSYVKMSEGSSWEGSDSTSPQHAQEPTVAYPTSRRRVLLRTAAGSRAVSPTGRPLDARHRLGRRCLPWSRESQPQACTIPCMLSILLVE